MADLIITAASVVANANASIASGALAGEAIPAGRAVYRHPVTRRYMLSSATAVTAAGRRVDGFSLNDAAAGQPLAIAKRGDVQVGAVLTPGRAYYLSPTPGRLCSFSDLTDGVAVLVGLARSASVLVLLALEGVTLTTGVPVPDGFALVLGFLDDAPLLGFADDAPLYGEA